MRDLKLQRKVDEWKKNSECPKRGANFQTRRRLCPLLTTFESRFEKKVYIYESFCGAVLRRRVCNWITQKPYHLDISLHSARIFWNISEHDHIPIRNLPWLEPSCRNPLDGLGCIPEETECFHKVSDGTCSHLNIYQPVMGRAPAKPFEPRPSGHLYKKIQTFSVIQPTERISSLIYVIFHSISVVFRGNALMKPIRLI